MKKELKHNGFSLTEVLMAVGILSIGMMLIATMFPVGIYLTTVATERTMAAIVADEAIAKIQLYGLKISSSVGLLLITEIVRRMNLCRNSNRPQ